MTCDAMPSPRGGNASHPAMISKGPNTRSLRWMICPSPDGKEAGRKGFTKRLEIISRPGDLWAPKSAIRTSLRVEKLSVIEPIRLSPFRQESVPEGLDHRRIPIDQNDFTHAGRFVVPQDFDHGIGCGPRGHTPAA